MPTRAKMIPYLSRKDGDPQKHYPIGGTYLSHTRYLSLSYIASGYWQGSVR